MLNNVKLVLGWNWSKRDGDVNHEEANSLLSVQSCVEHWVFSVSKLDFQQILKLLWISAILFWQFKLDYLCSGNNWVWTFGCKIQRNKVYKSLQSIEMFISSYFSKSFEKFHPINLTLMGYWKLLRCEWILFKLKHFKLFPSIKIKFQFQSNIFLPVTSHRHTYDARKRQKC